MASTEAAASELFFELLVVDTSNHLARQDSVMVTVNRTESSSSGSGGWMISSMMSR